MLRIYADFNGGTHTGGYWILRYLGRELDHIMVADGDRVILYQDPGDFEVEATMKFEHVSEVSSNKWVAHPDWATKRPDSCGIKLNPIEQ